MVQTFSRRTDWDLSSSPFASAITEAMRQGKELIDLTISNPTTCGFRYDAAALLRPLTNPEALTYDPDAKGLRSAREAVACYYAQRGADVDPDGILLTTSTSEAYSFLFRLLCDPGDEVLVAQPSYPLFDFLATLDNIHLTTYPLFYDFGWWIDFAELERRITARTRAILVVHPNNPTGHWTHLPERQRLEDLCMRHGFALIVDEVFLDYAVDGAPAASSFATGSHPALTFVLSGISKVAALPQMKVGWVAALGPDPLKREALARLEVIADTFLSMNAPAQFALPSWLAGCQDLQEQIRERVDANFATLRRSGREVLHVEAGWSAVMKLRGSTAADLLEGCGVMVHPGFFYGMADLRLVVVSLLTPTEVFTLGVDRLCTIDSAAEPRE